MAAQNTAFAEFRQFLEAQLSQGAVSPSGRPHTLIERPPPRPDDEEHVSGRRSSEPFTESDKRTHGPPLLLTLGLPSRGGRPPVPRKPPPQTVNSPPERPLRTTGRDGRAPLQRPPDHRNEPRPPPSGLPSLPRTTTADTVAEDIKSMRWYHGNITKEAGNQLLSNNRYPKGSYLVRDSASQAGDYVIMQKTDNEEPPDIINIRISCSKSPRGSPVYSREGNPTFPTMTELINYYSANLSHQSSFCILTSYVKRVDDFPDQVAAIGGNSSSSGSDSEESSQTDELEVETETDYQYPPVAATTLTAIHDCVASYPTVLSFNVDDVLMIEEHGDGEWSLAKNIISGQKGFILAQDGSLFVQNRPTI